VRTETTLRAGLHTLLSVLLANMPWHRRHHRRTVASIDKEA
jgi:hypothetical protein